VSAAAAGLPRRQRLLPGGEPVLEPPRVDLLVVDEERVARRARHEHGVAGGL
jgi:hypothetical protein